MEEEWRDLGREATRQLLLVGTASEPLALAYAARWKLAARAVKALLFLFHGAAPVSATCTPTESPDGVCPTVDLERARREIARLGAMHRAAGLLFALYGVEHPGGDGDGNDQRCRRWEERRAGAERHFDATVRRLLSAASQVVVGGDTIRIVSTGPSPRLSPRWLEYAPVEEKIARRASHEATMAMDEVRLMRDAVVLEFFDAWAVLIGR